MFDIFNFKESIISVHVISLVYLNFGFCKDMILLLCKEILITLACDAVAKLCKLQVNNGHDYTIVTVCSFFFPEEM